MMTSASQICGIMPVIGVLLTPVFKVVNSLCSINPKYTHKKGMDDRVSALPLVSSPCPIVIFPKYTPIHAKPASHGRCTRCSSTSFIVKSENRICRFCGESGYYEEQVLYPAGAVIYSRNYNDNASKRINHFKNWIARLQGKEHCSISSENMDAIAARVVYYPDSMTEYQQIKTAMKELGFQKYYNHVYYVMRNIMGYSLVEFRRINEARLLALFMRIQEPFSRIQRGRTNMLSYQFLIKKFCELLGYKVAAYIPLLKSRANLQRQDLIWSEICEELGLPFYASV